MKPLSALKRIQRLKKLTPVHSSEAAILEDMLHAARPETFPILDFIANYLPEVLPEPRGGGGRLIGEDSELNALPRRIRRDALSATLCKQLRDTCLRLVARESKERIDWREQKRLFWQNRHGHWLLSRGMQMLAWGGRLGRVGEYEHAAKQILLAIARRRHGWGPLGCNYGRPYNGWLNDNLLDIGHATLGPAIVFSLLRDRFSQAEAAEVVSYFEPYFYRALTYRYDGLRHPGHNFAPIGFGGAALLALASWPDIPEARRAVLREVLAWAVAYARFTLDTVGGKDGAAVEGSAYGSASLYYLALFAEGLRRSCRIDLFSHPTWSRFVRYLLLETLPGGGAFNNFNDNDYQTDVSFWPLVARRSGDAAGDLIWRDHLQADPHGGFAIRPQAFCTLPYELLFREPGHDALTPAQLGMPTVRFFRDQHHWVARTGWERKDLHVSFQCTRGRPGGHSQRDRLNFTLYALGEHFAIDSGYGLEKIPGSSEVRRLGRLTESHNVVLMDRQEQRDTIAPNAGRILAAGRGTGSWVWALGDALGAYEGVKLVRRCVAVRLTSAAPIVIVADFLAPLSPGRHRFDWLLHTATGNRLSRLSGGGLAIKGGRSGGCLRVCHLAAGRERLQHDTWLGHPRLRWISAGKQLIALTVFAAMDNFRRISGRNNLSIGWSEDAGESSATLAWRSDAKRRLRSLRLLVGNFEVKLV